MPTDFLGNAIFSVIPTILFGLVFWFIFRAIIRADRGERTFAAKIEVEERAKFAAERAAARESASATQAAASRESASADQAAAAPSPTRER